MEWLLGAALGGAAGICIALQKIDAQKKSARQAALVRISIKADQTKAAAERAKAEAYVLSVAVGDATIKARSESAPSKRFDMLLSTSTTVRQADLVSIEADQMSHQTKARQAAEAAALEARQAALDGALHKAAKAGKIDDARAALQKKPELIYRVDADGCLPLHLACAKGRFTLAKLLYNANPTAVSARDTKQNGWTPLHYAASLSRVDNSELIGWLLKETEADVLATTNPPLPQTALDLAERKANHYNLKVSLQLLREAVKEAQLQRKRTRNTDDDGEAGAPKRPATSNFGSQEQVTAFLQSGAALPVPENNCDVPRSQLNGGRSQFALRYALINEADSQPGHSTTKMGKVNPLAYKFVSSLEKTCRTFKIGITKNPKERAAHGFPASGYQVQYDRMDVIFRGTRDTAGGLEASLIQSFGVNGLTPSDKCQNDKPGDDGPKKDTIFYTYIVQRT